MVVSWAQWRPKDVAAPAFASTQEAADALVKQFTQKTRPGTKDKIWVFKAKEPPEWLVDIVRDIHGRMLPDDHKFDFITSALYSYAYDYDDPEEALDDIEADPYTSDLMDWFTSHSERRGYVDEARQEFGPGESVDNDIMMGQIMEKREVYWKVLEALKNLIE